MKVSLLVVAALTATGVFADKVVLKSGSFLTGTAGAVSGDSLVFTSDDLGEVKIKLANMAVQQAWSVRRLEQVVALGEAAAEPKQPKPRIPELGSLENMAREVFGTRVKLEGGLEKGKLVLSYYSQDDLQHIWDVIERMKV